MFGFRKGYQPKKPAHKIASPPHGGSAVKEMIEFPLFCSRCGCSDKYNEFPDEGMRCSRCVQLADRERQHRIDREEEDSKRERFQDKLALLDRLITLQQISNMNHDITHYASRARTLADSLAEDMVIGVDMGGE